MLKLFRLADGITVSDGPRWFGARDFSFDALFTADDPEAWLRGRLQARDAPELPPVLSPPLQSQEVWAAGVTYLRSRNARMAESVQEASVL